MSRSWEYDLQGSDDHGRLTPKTPRTLSDAIRHTVTGEGGGGGDARIHDVEARAAMMSTILRIRSPG